jgi:hypothetical protein
VKPIETEGLERGIESEKRFLSAVKEKTDKTPLWFVGVKRAPVLFDINGIDMIVRIKREDDLKPMSIPVGVVSSKRGRKSFYETRPRAKELKMPVMRITDAMTPDDIRTQLYDALKLFHKVPRDHFKSFLESAAKGVLGKRGRAIKKHIEQRRASE